MAVKVFVSGFGFMGQTHVRSLLNIPDVKVVGIIDPCAPAERLSTIRGNQATETVTENDIRGIAHFHSMEEAFQSCQADAIVIALPTKLHYDAVLKSLNAKLHVFVEKPFALSLQACKDMVQTARQNNRLLAVGYVVRCMKEYQFLRQTIASNRLGKLKYLKLSRITGVPNWGNWNDPEFIRASGGSLFDLVSHDVDFARFCLGEPDRIESVEGLGGSQFKMILSILHYRDLNVMIEGGFVTPAGYPFGRTFTAYFENGTLSSPAGGKVTEYQNGKITEHDFLPDNPYFTEVEHFIQAIKDGTQESVCSGMDACGTIQCCTQIAADTHYPMP